MLPWRKRSGEATLARLWEAGVVAPPIDAFETIEAVAALWRAYRQTPVDFAVSAHEDMFHPGPAAMDAYRASGLTAMRIVTEVMVLTGRTRFGSILDLPCGGGRVTRHLRAFFPEAELQVGDIDPNKVAAVTEQFGVTAFAFPFDFAEPPSRTFDLIFVGSLLTHLNAELFGNAIDFFVKALAPGGIAAISLHGRLNASAMLFDPGIQPVKAEFRQLGETLKKRKGWKGRNYDPDVAVRDEYLKTGFGYFTTPPHTVQYGQDYGGTYSAPSWVMQLVEARSDCFIVGYKERSYGDAQDVLMLQKAGL